MDGEIVDLPSDRRQEGHIAPSPPLSQPKPTISVAVHEPSEGWEAFLASKLSPDVIQTIANIMLETVEEVDVPAPADLSDKVHLLHAIQVISYAFLHHALTKGAALGGGKSKDQRTLVHRAVSSASNCLVSKTSDTGGTNLDHFTALDVLARACHASVSDFSFAGTKDKRAVTYQHVVAKNVSHEVLTSVQDKLEVQGLQVGALRYVERPLVVDKAIASVRSHGCINYFGHQRVGDPAAVPTRSHHIGRAMLQQDWPEALRLLFSQTQAQDLNSVLFNLMATYRVRTYGAAVVRGDLVLDATTGAVRVVGDHPDVEALTDVVLPLVGTKVQFPANDRALVRHQDESTYERRPHLVVSLENQCVEYTPRTLAKTRDELVALRQRVVALELLLATHPPDLDDRVLLKQPAKLLPPLAEPMTTHLAQSSSLTQLPPPVQAQPAFTLSRQASAPALLPLQPLIPVSVRPVGKASELAAKSVETLREVRMSTKFIADQDGSLVVAVSKRSRLYEIIQRVTNRVQINDEQVGTHPYATGKLTITTTVVTWQILRLKKMVDAEVCSPPKFKPSDVPYPLTKIAHCLSSLPVSQEVVVLVSSGAYNPVHMLHIRAFYVARQICEHQFPHFKFRVVYVCGVNTIVKLSHTALKDEGFGVMAICRPNQTDMLHKHLGAKWTKTAIVVEDVGVLACELERATSFRVRQALIQRQGSDIAPMVGKCVDEYMARHRIGDKIAGREPWTSGDRLWRTQDLPHVEYIESEAIQSRHADNLVDRID
ncbi:hypothetical protein DYB30_004186 [Aphanomyces astaci]|uniref:TRUD domain-containing protein n=1 Tax=Aphanomyces astaci TaxID=112090 RepID=A0A397DRQ9_APHAT|nr:hypothetical protein DYB30_004186 [Aphanomyces astaci]